MYSYYISAFIIVTTVDDTCNYSVLDIILHLFYTTYNYAIGFHGALLKSLGR